MTTAQGRSATGTQWRRDVAVAAGCAVAGVAVHYAGSFLPVPLATIGLGVGVIGAAFMLAWAADAGEAVFSGGLVLAVVALVAVLPEYIIELRFAFTQQAELVTANLTGSTRLLLTGAVALPLLMAYLARRTGGAVEPLRLAASRRLELAILLITSLFAIQIVIRGSLTVFDGTILLGLYVLYAVRVQGSPDEDPGVVGVAAGLLTVPPRYRRPAITTLIVFAGAVIILIANPFADGLLATGTSLGIDPYLLIQSVVPAATEAPEFVIVAVLVVNHRPAQGLALFLAASVSQGTLALGSLPFAYLAGGGGISLPLAGREQLELGFTICVTLFAVAALIALKPERVDAFLLTGVFIVQFLLPSPFLRFAAAFVLIVFAIDILSSRRRLLGPLLRTAFGRRSVATAGSGDR
jgi:cation:H+ antiporter